MADAQTAAPQTPEQATDAVNKMYRDSELFMSRWNALVAIAPYVKGTAMEPQFVTLMQDGKALRSRIDMAHSKVRDAYSRAGQIIAASWTKMRDYLGTDAGHVNMVSLPALPAASLAVAAAASAASMAMLGWARKADSFIAHYNGEVRSTSHTAGSPVNTGAMGALPAERTLLEKVGLPSLNSLGRLALVLGVVWGIGKWRKWW